MKQKRSRGLFEKAENASVRNTPAQRENTFCPKAFSENGSRGIEEGLTGGSHPSGSKTPNGARRRPPRASAPTSSVSKFEPDGRDPLVSLSSSVVKRFLLFQTSPWVFSVSSQISPWTKTFISFKQKMIFS